MPVSDEVVFHNGTVFDGRGFLPAGTCVRAAGGRITAVGPAGSSGPPGPLGKAEPVDLHGGTLLPGFVDAHAHPVFAGDQMRRCDLRAASTAAGYTELVASYARDHPDEEWISGGGWSMEAFPGGIPTRQALDAIVPDRPVFLPNRDGHGAWVNSRALALAGIDGSTPDPPDGRIERDAAGEPVGMLQEGAAVLVSRLLPEVTEEDWYQALLTAQNHLLSLGITGWQDAIVGRYHGDPDPLTAYMRAAEAGTLLATVVGALWWDRGRGLEQIGELLEQRRAGQAAKFRATTVKMMLDGVAENHTAAMLEPYLDGDGCSTGQAGLDFIDPGELPGFVTALDREGFQVHFHALGDRAVRNALDAVEAARRANGDSGLRHHLAHLQVVHPDDVPRFARVSATANIQPLWATHEPQMDELTIPFLGERRSGWQYPFRSLAAAGAVLCAGSDWPVSSPNPLWGAHVAVNRSLPAVAGGQGGDPFLPEQAIGLTSILAAYTSGSARLNGLGTVAGSIAEGYGADLAVVNADLAHLPAHEICDAAVIQTWIGGQVVYQQR
ncbi:MAG TPA: amidohydrolase family protein [Streptosporangiaceae bacterium]|nr:amidohydrolase family protein [Streptosporangiaceae bacterium]